MITVEQRLADVQNRPSGFDYLRIMLAIGVVLAHSFLLTHGPDGERGNWIFYFAPLIVPMAIVPLGWPSRTLGPPRREPFEAKTHRDVFGTPW